MKLSDDRQGDVLIVRPEGRIDTNTSEELEKWLASRLDGGRKRLVLDLGALDYISSAGLRVFLMTLKKAQGERRTARPRRPEHQRPPDLRPGRLLHDVRHRAGRGPGRRAGGGRRRREPDR